ncbi:hypothetical protein A4R44_03688 [Amycolatopsis sp. M39]|nr:hypothetical protein A4R44_03688 [Amycolatopsis sp. M39]
MSLSGGAKRISSVTTGRRSTVECPRPPAVHRTALRAGLELPHRKSARSPRRTPWFQLIGGPGNATKWWLPGTKRVAGAGRRRLPRRRRTRRGDPVTVREHPARGPDPRPRERPAAVPARGQRDDRVGEPRLPPRRSAARVRTIRRRDRGGRPDHRLAREVPAARLNTFAGHCLPHRRAATRRGGQCLPDPAKAVSAPESQPERAPTDACSYCPVRGRLRHGTAGAVPGPNQLTGAGAAPEVLDGTGGKWKPVIRAAQGKPAPLQPGADGRVPAGPRRPRAAPGADRVARTGQPVCRTQRASRSAVPEL